MVLEAETELTESLEEIFEVEGVLGGIICTNSAEILSAKMPSVFDEGSIGAMTKKFSRVLASIKELKIKHDTVTLSYEEGTVLLKDLRRGFLVILVSATEINPLMEISFNMVRKKLLRLLTFSKKVSTEKVEVEELDEGEIEETTIPAEKIKKLNTELCRYLGPAGGVVIKKKSQKLGFSWNKLPVSVLKKFLIHLESMIESDKDALAFKSYHADLFKEYL